MQPWNHVFEIFLKVIEALLNADLVYFDVNKSLS